MNRVYLIVVIAVILLFIGCVETKTVDYTEKEIEVKQETNVKQKITTVKSETELAPVKAADSEQSVNTITDYIDEINWSGTWQMGTPEELGTFGNMEITDVEKDSFMFSMEAFYVRAFFDEQGLEIVIPHMGFLEGKANIVEKGKAVYVSDEVEDYKVIFQQNEENGSIIVIEVNTETGEDYGYSPLAGVNVRNSGEYRQETEGNYEEKSEETGSKAVTLAFTSAEKKDRIVFKEYKDYNNGLEIYDVNHDKIYSTKKDELLGKSVGLTLLDFDQDGLRDFLLELDLGSSSGTHAYHLYTYSKSYGVSHYQLEALHPKNRYDIIVKDDKVDLKFSDSEETVTVAYNESIYKNLENIGIENPLNYLWLPQEVGCSKYDEGKIIFTSKAKLALEHQLLEIAEVEIQYIFNEGRWEVIDTVVTKVNF